MLSSTFCSIGQICWRLLEICSFKQGYATIEDKLVCCEEQIYESFIFSEQVEVSIAEDYSQINFNGESYLLGEDVRVHSVLSNQNFVGTITKIDHVSFVVCSSAALRLCVLVEQVQRRRVLISKL